MSSRVEQILEVIKEVREEFQNTAGHQSVNQMRLRAVASVANRRGITKQSVLDKFIRQLRPDVQFAAGFDKLLEKWLVYDSDELENIILKHKTDRQDVELINNAFYKAPESDILLAPEFGYDPNEKAFKEGKTKLALHLRKERNRSLVNQAKALWRKQQGGNVVCSVCSFSFPETYGEVGKDFIEVHHV